MRRVRTAIGVTFVVALTLFPAAPALAHPLYPTGESPSAAPVDVASFLVPFFGSVSTPAPDPLYRVQAGDTLSGIAAKFNTNLKALVTKNNIGNPNLIAVGQVLKIFPGLKLPGQVTFPAAPGVSRPVTAGGVSWSQRPVTTGSPGGSAPAGVWSCIAAHESGGNPGENTGNGYYGMYQFAASTWQTMMSQLGLGYQSYPYAAAAPASVQTAAAIHLQAESGWGQWPVTSRECGV